MKENLKPQYVFVVGCDRTGTTLLTRIFNKNSEICLSNQTHFMGHLIRPGLRQIIRRIGDLSDDNNVHKLVDFMYSKPLGGGAYWTWLQKNVDKAEVLQRILNSDRSDRTLLAILMQLPAKGESVLLEKTPDHIKYVPTLLEWFPEAKIIQTIRDPRAVYISELKRRQRQTNLNQIPYKQLRPVKPLFSLFVLSHMTFEWLYAARLYFKYKNLYPNNYLLLKFEDLISEPEQQIKQLCDFIGVEFQAEMLEQKVTNSAFSEQMNKKGFDKQAVDRWRAYISPQVKLWFAILGKGYLKKLGYTS